MAKNIYFLSLKTVKKSQLGKFECLDEVYAWCYAPEPPELPKEIKEK